MAGGRIPNPVWHALVAWFSHTANWTLLGGVILGIVAAVAPTWTGQEKLVAIGNQLALLIPLACALIAAAQKWADGRSHGETSAFNQWQCMRNEARERGDDVDEAITEAIESLKAELNAPKDDLDDTKMDLPGGKKIGKGGGAK